MAPRNDPRKKKGADGHGPLRSRETSARIWTSPNRSWEAGSQRFLVLDVTDRLINWRTWENGHLPADEMDESSAQHHNCLFVFMARETADKVTPTNKRCQNRYTPTRCGGDLMPQFYVKDFKLKTFYHRKSSHISVDLSSSFLFSYPPTPISRVVLL